MHSLFLRNPVLEIAQQVARISPARVAAATRATPVHVGAISNPSKIGSDTRLQLPCSAGRATLLNETERGACFSPGAGSVTDVGVGVFIIQMKNLRWLAMG